MSFIRETTITRRIRPSSLYGSSSSLASNYGSGGGYRSSSSILDLYRPSYTSSSLDLYRPRSSYSSRSSRGLTGGYRPHYQPSYRSSSSRPQYERSFWWEQNYPPLRAESDDEDQEQEDEGIGNGGKPTKPKKDVKTIDLNVTENREAHHTSKYGNPALIVRRGHVFTATVRLNKPYKPDTDEIKVQLTIGDKPLQSKGTLVRFPANKDGGYELLSSSLTWGARVDKVEAEGKLVRLSVMPPADCIVGEYNFFVELYRPDDDGEVKMIRHKAKDTFFILFNAWCEDDQVFLQDEEERQEYVLNEIGRIYVGNANNEDKNVGARPWNFGQMSKSVLRCALKLLHDGSLSKQAQSNPTQVVRCLSAMANSNDDDEGILEGNWSGKYYGGTSPSDWNGSVAIIEQYNRTKKAVKYGQCWVYSGLLVTLCRALGIPTRSVTNYSSAHDTDYSMTIDTHVDQDGRPLKHLDDSIWNFHVWNESWFRRPDLPRGNDGWQAFDATPQEASEGTMRCGPAPVSAIKRGDVIVSYDAKFIFAEVNGDRIVWTVADQFSGEMVPTSYNYSCVGKFISTKAVGANSRNDVTDLYKFPEDSEEERQAVKQASQHSSRSPKLATFYAIDTAHDVEFTYEGKCEQNGDISILLSAKNTCEPLKEGEQEQGEKPENRNLVVNMYAVGKYYTGTPGQEISDQHVDVSLEPGEFKEVKWLIGGTVYLPVLDEDATLGCYIMAKVKETGQIYTNDDTYLVDVPDLEVETSNSKPAVGEEFEVTVRYTNQLSVRMTECRLFLESAGIQKHKKVLLDSSFLLPGATLEKTIKLTAKHDGQREIIANFHSKQVVGITGAVEVDVQN